ncbi:unnamed protein product [Gadus morhua 'NCC']
MWCLGSVCKDHRLYHHIQDCLLFEHHTTYRPSISSKHKERRPQGRDGYAGVSVFAGSARGQTAAGTLNSN